MALELEQLEAVTTDYWKKKDLTDIYFTENVLLWKLLGNGNMENFYVKGSDLVDGGTMIRKFLEYAKANSGSYGNTTTIPVGKVPIVNAARFRWAAYYASNTIDFDERRQNSGGAQLVDLVYTKMKNIEKTIRDTMGAAIYASAADGNSFLGLGNLFSTVTATSYGSIAEDDMSAWAAETLSAGRAISFLALQEIWREAAIGQSSKAKPNIAITTEALKDGYERTLQTQQRFSDVALVNAGFENILFKGAPVIGDDNQASGTLDALNLRHMWIQTHKDFNFTEPKWRNTVGKPDTFTADTRWSGQLTTNHRAAHCRETGLTEPT